MASNPNTTASPASEAASKPSRRREKPQLSCSLCRRRKLKCDRQQPCSACSVRGFSLSCTYMTTNTSGKVTRPQQQQQPRDSSPASIQARIDQLETLVASLAQNPQQIQAAPHPTESDTTGGPLDSHVPDDSTESLNSDFGRITLTDSKSSYVGSSHWTAIIDKVRALRRILIAEQNDRISDDDPSSADDEDGDDSMGKTSGPELLFGKHNYATREEILAALPPRETVDRLLAVFFQYMDMAPVFIHGPTFLEEYEKFWKDPLNTPIMWVGLLFCLLCQTIQFHDDSRSANGQLSPSSRRLVTQYRRNIVQCLILGKYTRTVPYTVEVFFLYFQTEQVRTEGTTPDNWILLGMLVRVALRMGYHRDPSHFSKISPFRGEMRRRLWAAIIQLDLAGSNVIGLPRMIQESQCDTAEPRNLLDEDFGPNCTELPVPRPDSFQTPILYLREKKRALVVSRRVYDLTSTAKLYSYDDVMNLDAAINDVKNEIPPALQLKPLTILTNPVIWTRQMSLSIILAEAQCVLHRRYLAPGRTDPHYRHSRITCIEAALQMLDHQSTFNREKAHGGKLYEHRWKYNSLINYDFLLAATLLSVDLDHDIAVERKGETETGSAGPEMEVRGRIIKALRGSYEIWLLSYSSSKDARIAASAIGRVLGKACGGDWSHENHSDTTSSWPPSVVNCPSQTFDGSTAASSGEPSLFPSLGDENVDMVRDHWDTWDLGHMSGNDYMVFDGTELPQDNFLDFLGV